jgi:hypothetical protein
VGDVNDGRLQAAVKLADLRPHGDPQFGIQVGERLVEQKHLGLAHDGPAHRHALTLPARKLLGPAVQQVVDAEDVGRLLNPPVDLVLGELAHFQPEAQVLAHAHMGIEGVVLKHHGDVPVLGPHIVDEPVADVDLSGAHRIEPGNHPQCRGFAASGGPDQNGEFLVLDFDGQAVDGGRVLELLDHALKKNPCQ